jgi:Sulfotransferase family
MPNRRLERPVFIISPPRSGSTLLYKVLSDSPDAWTTRQESHRLIETIPGMHPRDRGWTSNRLTADDAQPEVVAELTTRFLQRLANRDDRAPEPGDRLFLLEKTPKNILRIPFFAAAYPDARFVFLYREPAETINSMIEGWRLPPPTFKQYLDLPGWEGPTWSFYLFPGWREVIGRPVPQIVATQWATGVQLALDDLQTMPADRWYAARFGDLLADPAREVEAICDFLGWSYDRPLTAPLPLSVSVITAPKKDKWRGNAEEIEAVLPLAQAAIDRASGVVAQRRSQGAN